MSALNFKPQWVEKIRTGTKTQTIRELRAKPIQQGEFLYLYVGQRTKNCHKIAEVPCSKVEEIYFGLNPSRDSLWMNVGNDAEFLQLASPERIEKLAIADGFPDLEGFIDFFFPKKKRSSSMLPLFRGQVIHWDFNELELMCPTFDCSKISNNSGIDL